MTDEAVIAAVERFLMAKEKQWCNDGIAELRRRWTKCIDAMADSVEKENEIFSSRLFFVGRSIDLRYLSRIYDKNVLSHTYIQTNI